MRKELSACFGEWKLFNKPVFIKVKSVSELLENVNALLSHGNRILVSSPSKLTTLHLAVRIPSAFWGPYVPWDTKKAGYAQRRGPERCTSRYQRAKGGVSTSRRTS